MISIIKRWKFQNGAKSFYKFVFTLFISQFFIRLYELTYIAFSNPDFQFSIGNITSCFLFDVSFILFVSGVLLPIFILTNAYFPKTSKIGLFTLVGLFTLAGFLCSRFYATTLVPVGKVVFSYSISDQIKIVQTEGGIRISDFIFICFQIILILSIQKHINKWVQNKNLQRAILVFILIFAVSHIPIDHVVRNKTTNKQYFEIVNKSYYFFRDILTTNDIETMSSKPMEPADVKNYQSEFSIKEFTNPDFPLLHKKNKNSTLLPFFKPLNENPNIVIVIVESLSRKITGPNAELGSFTPFLDSLRDHSLYWENFISTSERTIGVLPSLLGSLPHAKNGFASLGGDMPNHLTLASILKKNAYQTNFFYGGDSWFDNMNVFISRQGFDYIASGKFYTLNNSVFWGDNDSIMFMKSINYIDEFGKTPFLNLYLTLSTHGPFDFPSSKYNDSTYTAITQNMDLKSQKTVSGDNEKMIKSFIYTDNQLRGLFNAYRERPEYANTIFVITGDHGIASISQENQIKKYHTPLIIFSPLLKKPQTFKGMSSHYDITPSLLSLIENETKLKTPDEVHWLGGQLDTSSCFGSNINLSIMEINREVNEFVNNKYFYSQDRLFEISDNLNCTEISNDSLLLAVNISRLIVGKTDYYSSIFNKIIPEKIAKLWGSIYELVSTKNENSLTIDAKNTYYNLVRIETGDNSKNYKVYFSCDFKLDSSLLEKIPIVAISVNTASANSVSYSQVPMLEPDKIIADSINHVSVTLETSIPKLYKDSTLILKVYIWNKDSISMKLKDLTIKTFTSNQ